MRETERWRNTALEEGVSPTASAEQREDVREYREERKPCFPEASVHLHISDYWVQGWSKTGLGNKKKSTQAPLPQ